MHEKTIKQTFQIFPNTTRVLNIWRCSLHHCCWLRDRGRARNLVPFRTAIYKSFGFHSHFYWQAQEIVTVPFALVFAMSLSHVPPKKNIKKREAVPSFVQFRITFEKNRELGNATNICTFLHLLLARTNAKDALDNAGGGRLGGFGGQ